MKAEMEKEKKDLKKKLNETETERKDTANKLKSQEHECKGHAVEISNLQRELQKLLKENKGLIANNMDLQKDI